MDLSEASKLPDAVLVSLDMKKGFDYADVDHTFSVFHHCGMPRRWTEYLQLVCSHQRRYVQIGVLLDTAPVVCTRSLPEGHPLVPLGFCLLPPRSSTEAIRVPRGSCMSLFVDDRNILVDGHHVLTVY